eukprot:scaffold167_cov347-Prasinococcus_capsulatus_cf.AAC.11
MPGTLGEGRDLQAWEGGRWPGATTEEGSTQATTHRERLPACLPSMDRGASTEVRYNAGVTYVCGDCGAENLVKPGDAILCRECGYRILYKKRTKRIVQYEAR